MPSTRQIYFSAYLGCDVTGEYSGLQFRGSINGEVEIEIGGSAAVQSYVDFDD